MILEFIEVCTFTKNGFLWRKHFFVQHAFLQSFILIITFEPIYNSGILFLRDFINKDKMVTLYFVGRWILTIYPSFSCL